MAKIVPLHPHLVSAHQDGIISSIEDQDISLRMRALDLVSSMRLPRTEPRQCDIHPPNLSHAQQQRHPMSLAISVTRADASPAPSIFTSASRLEVSCGISVLVDLAYVSNVGSIGRDINDKLLDVVVRVKGMRAFAARLMLRLLNDEILLENCRDPTSYSEVLWAAAWSCRKYYLELASSQGLVALLLQPNVMLLREVTIAVYLQTALKVFRYWAAEVSKHCPHNIVLILVLKGGAVIFPLVDHREQSPGENRSTGTGLERYLGEVRLWQ
ncbi:hypothetical protein BS47DRAFT_1401941 [Hydnum rufescens UP504]|uniref:Uncharacterized protein n=1 Tax=Hydnum rufescens UP504 TaxID=1448309 RepID=A0A9P6DM59_9AGAM|nr:hypothetical protein BS47DRAFT_1401941 [Hydnum rufescens UP504]